MFAPVVFSEKENEMDSSRIQYDRWLSQPSLDASLRAELSAMADDAHAIDNAFGCELTFGTGGLRGILGAGTNRMNVHVVRRAAQAVADYLSGTALPKRAAIGYDSRIGSARFARETAAVFAANGIEAYIYPRLEPVPALSFAVRALSCGVGGGTTKGMRTVSLAKDVESQGAMGVVLNAPISDLNLLAVSKAVDIPVIATVTREDTDIAMRLESGASILNIACGYRTPEVVRKIREQFRQVPLIASGGKTNETVRETILAGVNAITYTPPSAQDLFKTIMAAYRE